MSMLCYQVSTSLLLSAVFLAQSVNFLGAVMSFFPRGIYNLAFFPVISWTADLIQLILVVLNPIMSYVPTPYSIRI